MANLREKTPIKRMRKIVLVICEGETEENYINLLKKWYKTPIRIISHIEGTKITQSLIDNRAHELKISKRDKVKTFLMYDMDVPAINKKIKECTAEKLLSNPCFEIWLLLHLKDQKVSISTNTVIKELKKSAVIWQNYVKSSFSETQKTFLKKNVDVAINRAKKLKEFQNPSSGVYKLVQVAKNG